MSSSIYTSNKVLVSSTDETPSFEEYFGSSTSSDPDYIMFTKRYIHLANENSVYLLRPDYERVVIVDFLVEPLLVKRVYFPWCGRNTETVSVRDLVKPHVRKDGKCELRKVEVEGNYTPSRHDNVSCWDSDRAFKDEYLERPLKRVSIGDVVYVQPLFNRYTVVSGRVDGLGFIVEPAEEGRTDWGPLYVEFEDVVVLQSFRRSDGSVTKVFLKPDFRGVN